MSNGCNECIHNNPDFVDKVCLHCTWSPLSAHPSFFEPKPITNADRIRGMSDEELAEFISGKARTFGEEYEGYMSALDWLKGEVVSDG